MVATPNTRHAKVKQWELVSSYDVNNLLGVLIAMGLYKTTIFECFWQRGINIDVIWYKNYVHEQIRASYALLRFTANLSNIQIGITDSINFENSLENYSGKDVVVNKIKGMCCGRTVLRNYIQNKVQRHRLRLYELCTTDGYTGKFILYLRRRDSAPHFSLTVHLTLFLTYGLYDEGQTL